jgi:Na+/melibiose symporter-like transporter
MMTVDSRRLRRTTRWAFGIGALSSGLAGQAITILALIFYNQVVGMSAAAVGLALMISLVFDALWDPGIGLWSDRTRSSIGRRHPFMYASVVPAGVAFWALWSPPLDMSDGQNFVWLLGSLLAVRFFISLSEIPSTSLAPEMAPDYDARTSLIAGRYFWGVIGGVLASMLAFQGFLSDRVGGIANMDGYVKYGLTGGAIIAVTVLISSLGTHKEIPNLTRASDQPFSSRDLLREVRSAFTNRNFASIMIAALFSGMNAGISGGLGVYFNLYFFELSTDQISLLVGPVLLASLVGVIFAPILARTWGKKRVVMVSFGLAIFASTTPIGLRLLGILPGNDWPWLVTFLVVETFFATTLVLIGLVVSTSMLADVVEDNAVRTANRSEGLFFAANSVLSKAVTGLGTLVAGLMLTWVKFPTHATPGSIDPSLMHELGYVYVPVGVTLSVLSLYALSYFDIDRATHEANLSKLEAAALADVGTIESGNPVAPSGPALGVVPGMTRPHAGA